MLCIDRTSCIEQLNRYYQEELPALQKMEKRLPKELVGKILGQIVFSTTTDVLRRRNPDDLHLVAASILSPQIPEVGPFRVSLEGAILECLPIRFDIAFIE